MTKLGGYTGQHYANEILAVVRQLRESYNATR